MSKYRLLIVNHAVEIGGAEKVLLSLLDNLDPNLFEPSVASPDQGPLTAELESRDIRVFYGFPSPRLLKVRRMSVGASRAAVLLYPFDMLTTILRLTWLIHRKRFDLVLTNSAKADIYGSLAGYIARRPVVWRLHDIVGPEAFSRLNITLFKIAASHFATRVLAVSEATRKAFIAQGLSEDKVRRVYNGVDLSSTTPKPDTSIRKELGLNPSAPLAAMIGRLVHWKGPDTFIKAAAAVSREIPEARFLLVGDAIFGEQSYVEELKNLAGDLGLGDKLVFTGFRSDIPEIMASADVIVHASILPDPLPTVLLEAMAQSKPVIGARAGGVPEIIEDGVSGIVFAPGNVSKLSDAMTQLLADREKAAGMGAEGFRRALRLFEVKKNTRLIENELVKAIEEGKQIKKKAD